MSQRQKVIWFEGMNLDPHHFQQWERYHKSLLDFRIRSIIKFDWGILDISIDKEGIVNGQFNLLKCKGITPDGLIFNIPDEDPAPHSRNIQELFQATQNELSVFLVIPSEKERGRNCILQEESGKKEMRYILNNISVNDDNTGANEREIGIGRTNFQLRFGNDPLEDFSVMKIAEIVRASDGSFALNDQFIPPCLTLDASENLITISRRLLELLIAKSSAFSEHKHFAAQTECTPTQIRSFWILQILNSYIPILNHIYSLSKVHPEELYVHLLMLVGQLTTFSPDSDIDFRKLPIYDHKNLSKCFNEIDKTIRGLLDSLVYTKNYINIPLQKKSESLYIGKVGDTSLFQESNFFLVFSGDIQEKKMIDAILANIRVASPDTIDAVLGSFSKALPLIHAPTAPSGLPIQEDTQYFRLDPSGTFWEAICRSSSLAIFIPTEFSDIQIKVVAVKQS